jgi:hypothetical protein
MRPYLEKYPTQKRAGGVAQAVYLPRKREGVQTSVLAKKKKKKKINKGLFHILANLFNVCFAKRELESQITEFVTDLPQC